MTFSELLDFLFERIRFTCIFHEITGLYCPGCGGTRSLKAFLQGDFLLSLHENPAVILGVLVLFWRILGNSLHLFPKSQTFWTILAILFLIWSVLRNFIPVLQPYTEI